MTGVELIAFESYSDLFGQHVTFQELSAYVGKFSRNSVLWVCSYINVALQLWVSDGSDSENLGFVLHRFFPEKLSAQLFHRHLSAGEHKRLLFHRRQLLFLAKLALINCKDSGLNASLHTREFGPCFLYANDHFHFDLIPPNITASGAKRDLANMIAELLAPEEYGRVEVPNVYVRSREMCLELPKLLASHPDYCNIAEMFYEVHGLQLTSFQYLTFGITSRFGLGLSTGLKNNPMTLPVKYQDFSTVKAAKSEVFKFFEIVSATPALASCHPSLSRLDSADRSKWANDSTVFRQSPLMMQWFGTGTAQTFAGFLLMDHSFLFQKVMSEPFFTCLKAHGEKFSRFWGAVFEQYVHRIFEQSIRTSTSTYTANPKLSGSLNDELCDGAIVDGRDLVLLEYKSSLIRADRKYQGDSSTLTQEITEKFVFNTKDKRPKAVTQLARAVKTLFGGAERARVDWCDIEAIERCYVITITLDTIGGAIGIATFLDAYFQDNLAGSTLHNLDLRPFYCTDIETLERLSGGLEKKTFSSILEKWFVDNPSLAMPLVTVRMVDLLPLRPPWLWDVWERFTDEAIHFIFGELSPEAEAARLKLRTAQTLRNKVTCSPKSQPVESGVLS